MFTNTEIARAMHIKLDEGLPEKPEFQKGIRRAPDRGFRLTREQSETAVKNALRYVPEQHHNILLPEFLEELRSRGRIYGYRYRPPGPIKAKPIDKYRETALPVKHFS